jgi:hypothetical protein
MPGYLLHMGATVLCMHGGQAQPVMPYPRVKVGGQPVVTQSAPYTVAGCGLTGTPSPPCVTAQCRYFCRTASPFVLHRVRD